MSCIAHKKGSEKNLPSFWVPSLTPSVAEADLKTPSKETLCLATNHPLKLKNIVEIVFTPSSLLKMKVCESKGVEEKPVSKRAKVSNEQMPDKVVRSVDLNDRWICPGCTKGLSNGPKLSVIKACGHLLCDECVNGFIKGSDACFVCSKSLKHKGGDKDVIRLRHDGTGHAGHGESIEVNRYNYAFQC